MHQCFTLFFNTSTAQNTFLRLINSLNLRMTFHNLKTCVRVRCSSTVRTCFALWTCFKNGVKHRCMYLLRWISSNRMEGSIKHHKEKHRGHYRTLIVRISSEADAQNSIAQAIERCQSLHGVTSVGFGACFLTLILTSTQPADCSSNCGLQFELQSLCTPPGQGIHGLYYPQRTDYMLATLQAWLDCTTASLLIPFQL